MSCPYIFAKYGVKKAAFISERRYRYVLVVPLIIHTNPFLQELNLSAEYYSGQSNRIDRGLLQQP